MKSIKIKIKNILKSKIKYFILILNSKMVKADIFWVKEKNKFIRKQRRHTKTFDQKVFNFLI